ncbi:MAG: ParB N-terminal domain-containing protein, partial [Anaerolineales bacterium]
MEKKALGKGLEALLPGQGPAVTTVPREAAREVPLHQVMPNPFQPRRDFDEQEILQLAESIKQNGILQPILVRRKGDGVLELIAGERRLRAAKLAGLSQIPIVIRTSTDEQSMALAL